ncbi:RidA family protein [Microbacterium sp.]|uniref:RidA family protein n=1 Tax=Microbacterium sp. TaxID=51671 RepID=UPI001ACD2BB7|nr:RidA family protein [Microbacterium sp.]MBN9180783.1 RidA family protein [Microbacterium sp.]MBN9185929.1 RidA family protein [Microbacterium sp.]MBN9192172.1 RidA family protein [Microbacterium sp.]
MEHITDGSTPTGTYSPAVVAEGRFVFVSGQGPLVDGVVVAGTVAEQTRITLRNVQSVLAAAGATLDDVVRCGVFLADIADFAEMDAAYGEFFSGAAPARTTVGAALAGISVEIDCIARLADR